MCLTCVKCLKDKSMFLIRIHLQETFHVFYNYTIKDSNCGIKIKIKLKLKLNLFKQPYIKTYNLISLLTLPIVEVIIGSWTKQWLISNLIQSNPIQSNLIKILLFSDVSQCVGQKSRGTSHSRVVATMIRVVQLVFLMRNAGILEIWNRYEWDVISMLMCENHIRYAATFQN